MSAAGGHPLIGGRSGGRCDWLRSSDVYLTKQKINVAAQQLFRPKFTVTCGFKAGYQAPLLSSESQRDHQSTDAPVLPEDRLSRRRFWCFR